MIPWLTSLSPAELADAMSTGLAIVTLKATFLLLVALLATIFLRRSGAAVRHLLWVCTLGLFLALPPLALAIPAWHIIPGWLSRGMTLSGQRSPARSDAPSTSLILRPSELAAAEQFPVEEQASNHQMSEGPQQAHVPSSMNSTVITSSITTTALNRAATPVIFRRFWLLTGLWFTAALFFLLRLSLSAGRLWRCSHAAESVVSGPLFDELMQLRRELQVRQPVQLLLGDGNVMPMAWGVRRPRILVPRSITTWPAPQRRAVLLHELGHVARHDPLSQIVVELARALYWFHPLVWLATWRVDVERERACDDLVLNRGVAAGDYARHLLDVVSGGRLRRITPALGVAMAGSRRLEGRIRGILDESRNRRPLSLRIIAAALAACCIVGIPLAAMHAESAPAENSSVAPEIQRTRELIYLLRQHRVFSRDEEWARNIRELVEIGNPAVPELVAELDRTDRNSTLRSLGFALRAIGDPRAVPALIRAIPKTRDNQGSDCGVLIIDPELRAFMQKHQNHPQPETDFSTLCGRPVNEITTALEKLIGAPMPFVGKEDTRRERWLAWWKEHNRDFAEDAALKAIARRPKEIDLVEQAGLAKFGPLFPAGPEWRLGPIQEVTLDQHAFANGKAFLDLDTGRVWESMEGYQPRSTAPPVPQGFLYQQWTIERGIDVINQGVPMGSDLNAWRVDNDRWETLEEELKSGETVDLGEENDNYLAPFNGPGDQKIDTIGTFLFTTREGGRGILRSLPNDARNQPRRLQYRLIESVNQPRVESPSDAVAADENTRFGKPVTLTLPSFAAGGECFLDLETQKTFALPAELEKALKAPHSPLHDADAAKWAREQGIEVTGRANGITKENEDFAKGGAVAIRSDQFPGIQLYGLGMTAVVILPKSFYTLSVEEARELFTRLYYTPPEVASMSVGYNTPGLTQSYAIRTRDGSIGLVKLEILSDQPEKILLRYRLHTAGNE